MAEARIARPKAVRVRRRRPVAATLRFTALSHGCRSLTWLTILDSQPCHRDRGAICLVLRRRSTAAQVPVGCGQRTRRRSHCSGRECGGTIKCSTAKYQAMWSHLDKSPLLAYSARRREGRLPSGSRLLAKEAVSGIEKVYGANFMRGSSGYSAGSPASAAKPPITSWSLGNDLYGF